MKLIKSFVIDTKEMSSSPSYKTFRIIGDDGAVFSLRVRRSNGDYYDFGTNAFASTLTSKSRLANARIYGEYSGNISIPAAASGDTYTIELFAEPHWDTQLSRTLVSSTIHGSGDTLRQTLSHSPYYYRTIINQKGDSKITFTLASKANSAKYIHSSGTNYSVTDVEESRSPSSKGVTKVDISWTVKAALQDNANGFVLIRQPLASDFEISSASSPGGTSYTVDTATTAVKTVKLVTVDGLSIGNTITNNYSGATIPEITDINYDTNTLILDVVQTLAVNTILTFTGGGSSNIKDYSGASMTFKSNLKAATEKFEVVINGDHVGTGAIGIDSATGLVLGMTMTGPGFDNKTGGEQLITAINRSTPSMTVTSTQTIADNTTLIVSGGNNEATISATILVSSFPTDDTVITLDLDSILDPKGIT